MSQINLDTLYRQVIMDHYKNPRNRGSFEEDTLTVEMNNPTCGDKIFLEFQLNGDVVEDVRFNGEGCSISLASASMMTEAIKGQSISQALEMSELFSQMMVGEEIDVEGFGVDDIEALQGVSNFPARIKCATLAWKAMEKVAKEQ
ncbi:MAG TPA: SUF system NifU family Fe-S cluster assembly protein [Pseudogracilibacillus sp.]|nr:SUF system NifU family Fe-S cluster assembly protein [Pseudogracilibacillus sp.]